MPRPNRLFVAVLAPALLLLGALVVACPQERRPEVKPRLERASLAVVVTATLHPETFEDSWFPDHHLLTWSGGRAGKRALLKTDSSDTDVLDALEQLGGKPGNNLTQATWDERDDPGDPAPDRRVEGSRLELLVTGPDGKPRPIRELVVDVDERGFEWRLGGNRKLIPQWKSGCVVCLQSCPGAKIGNARATIRHLHRDQSRFQASKLAKQWGEGAVVQVRLRLVNEKNGGSRSER